MPRTPHLPRTPQRLTPHRPPAGGTAAGCAQAGGTTAGRLQAGRGLWCWLVSLLLLVVVVVAALRAVPVLIEYQAVSKAVRQAARAESEAEARAVFDRIAQVEGIRSIKGENLRLETGAGGAIGSPAGTPGLSFAYQREVQLAGPIYLTFKFTGRAP